MVPHLTASAQEILGSASAFVFDFDGTILDTEWPHFQAVREEYASWGLDLPLDHWQNRVGRADQPHWSGPIVADNAAADADDIIQRVRNRKYELLSSTPRPGVTALLDHAERSGIARAVASSSPRVWIDENLDRAGLGTVFDAIATRDDVVQAKPWPDVYLTALDRLGATADDAIAFEDSASGCTAALDAGLRVVVVPNRITAGGSFDGATVLASLADLFERPGPAID